MRPDTSKLFFFFPVASPSCDTAGLAGWSGDKTSPSCLSALLHRELSRCSKTQICTVNLKYITSNAEKIPSPKTPSQIIPWPKHKNCSQQLEEQTKP